MIKKLVISTYINLNLASLAQMVAGGHCFVWEKTGIIGEKACDRAGVDPQIR